MGYVESLSYDDLDCLELALSEDTTLALRFEQATEFEMRAVTRLDAIIQNAPTLKSPLVIYRAYKAAPELRNGADVKEEAFFAGSTLKPDAEAGVVILEAMVPTDGKVLQLDDTTYVLPRGLKLGMTGVPTTAAIADGFQLAEREGPIHRFPAIQLTEFFNKNHGKDGRFGAGPGGSSGSVSQESGKGFRGIGTGPAEVMTPRGYKTFRDRYAAIAWGNQHYATFNRNVPERLLNALDTYVWEGSISENLRREGEPPKGSYGEKVVKGVDEYLTKAPRIPENIMVYRGTHFSGDSKILKGLDDGSLKGKTIRDPGFVSTSLERRVAVKYSGLAAGGQKNKVIFEIEVPKGSKGAYVSGTGGKGLPVLRNIGAWSTQSEVLLPRGIGMRVRSVSTDSKGIRTVQATLVEAK